MLMYINITVISVVAYNLNAVVYFMVIVQQFSVFLCPFQADLMASLF